MKHSRVMACTLTAFLLYPAFALSQTATGSLSGIVTDVMSIAVPKAKVRATRKSDPRASYETRTDDSGKFTLANLPADVYKVIVTREDSGATTERVASVPQSKTIELEIRFGNGCDNVAAGAASDDDKAEVFRLTLAKVAAPDSRVVLSTRNIKRAWVQGLQGLRIQLLTPDEIQRKADNEGDFQFLSVPDMKVRSQCIAVTVSNSWAIGKASKNLYMSGGGFTYEYRKQSGKWIGRFINGWVL